MAENGTMFIYKITCNIIFQAPSPPGLVILPNQSSPDEGAGDRTSQSLSNRGNNSRWSTLSWDVPSDLLSPSTPESGGTNHIDSDSRPSSGMHINTPLPPTLNTSLLHLVWSLLIV